VLHQVGVGTLGPVFRTYEPTRDRLVAVKVFRLDITPEQAQALADELSKAAEAGLFHPSVVEPIAAGVEGTVAYRADEYVAAETLDVAMRHYAPAPIEKALPFITQLAGAIDFAHAADVGHGALHPRDIFVTPEEARASGFGVVEALERVGIRAPVRRPYAAPERVAGGAWGLPADVFSLAAVAYELLTARRPAGTGAQIGPLAGGSRAAAIHAVLVRAMAEDPRERYPSALAFASALDAATRGEGVPAVPLPVAAGDDDDALSQVAPPSGFDEREEPVEAEQEEDVFRVEESGLDDIAAEREEDQAYAALTLDEERAAGQGAEAVPELSLFEDEAVDDLSLDPGERDGTDRFAEALSAAPAALDEEFERPVAPAHQPQGAAEDEEEDRAAAFTPVPAISYDEPVVVPQREGFGLFSTGIIAVLALLVGFAAGHAVGGRGTASSAGDSVATSAGGRGATPAQPESAAKPYSEQNVTPPAGGGPPAGTSAAAGAATAGEPEPAPDRPSAPAATSGRIEVRSTPAAAAVTLDGRWSGRTPLTLEDVRFGTHEVRVVQPGFVTARERVTLSSSAPSRELSITLKRSAPAPAPRSAKPAAPPRPAARPTAYTGTIYVDSRPRGARVLINGKAMGITPVSIPDVAIGSHIVRLQLPDHRDWTTTTRVVAGQESRVTGSLEPIK
jgi:serine/threonine-protein kinase